MPGQLAYERLEAYVQSALSDQALGHLWTRDGLPLLSLGGDDNVQGFGLTFWPDARTEAYGLISLFEPESLYNCSRVAGVNQLLLRCS